MAPSNALTVEEIINGFPNPILPKIDHKPTFEDIQVTTRLLNANAISIPSMAGGGAHGHLGIIMTQVEYATISTSPWVDPFNPNAVPIIPPGTTAVDAAQIARMHAECRRIYTNRINVYQALKKLILEAYDNMYTSQLEDYLLQYANRSALEIRQVMSWFQLMVGFLASVSRWCSKAGQFSGVPSNSVSEGLVIALKLSVDL
jgi:hypothetical protein